MVDLSIEPTSWPQALALRASQAMEAQEALQMKLQAEAPVVPGGRVEWFMRDVIFLFRELDRYIPETCDVSNFHEYSHECSH